MNPLPFFAGNDQLSPAQIRQMTRCRRLRNANDFHQVVHAQLAPLQQVQDAKSRLVRKGAELRVGSIGVGAWHNKVSRHHSRYRGDFQSQTPLG